jgi:hypothetical protein
LTAGNKNISVSRAIGMSGKTATQRIFWSHSDTKPTSVPIWWILIWGFRNLHCPKINL